MSFLLRMARMISRRIENEPADAKVIPACDIKLLLILIEEVTGEKVHGIAPDSASKPGDNPPQPRNCETEREV